MYITRFAVLCDRTKDELEHFAADHPGVFVFPFCTKSVEDVPDYNGLACRDAFASYLDSSHIVQPFYVGNIRPKAFISQIIAIWLKGCEPTECVLDESLDL